MDTMVEQPVISAEFFAAKDSGEVILAVPKKCGLRNGDTLRVMDTMLVAMRDKSVLPIDFPNIEARVRERLEAFAKYGKPLPVGEFTSLGLVDAYFVSVVVA